MKTAALDFIGDIHGHYDKATALLTRLGYVAHNGTFRHPEGRKVIFLGDYIDRGPKIRETLHLVRGMVDAGDAHAIMGNHEYNAVCYATPDGSGSHLRERTPEKVAQHAATLKAFEDRPAEWREWLDWFKHLPFILELDGVRAVHACWDAKRLPLLRKNTLEDESFLHATAKRMTPEHRAIEHVLKGPELDLPEGVAFKDKSGTGRKRTRARWWNLHPEISFGELNMPPGSLDSGDRPESWALRRLPCYAADEVPVFFGHYWMPPDTPKAPLAPNLACLDYSGAFGGNPLIAYRWNGERTLAAENFVTGPD